MLSQLRESDLSVGDASRTLSSSSGLLELLPIYQPQLTILGVMVGTGYGDCCAYPRLRRYSVNTLF